MTEAASEPVVDNADLPPVLRPLAETYGRDLLNAALRISGMTVACDQLLHRTRTSPALQSLVTMLMSSLVDLNNDLIEAKGWHLDDVVECIKEVGQLRQQETPRIVRPN